MTTAVKDADAQVWRWERVLAGPDTLDDDLGSIGTWVRPRKGPFGRRSQDEKEDYTLRRLLVAWKQRHAVSYPVTVCAERQRKGRPDFVLSWENRDDLGIEVTEAGKEDYQRWVTAVEDRSGAADFPCELSISSTADDLRRAIQEKVVKFDDEGSYRVPGGCDLLVYNNPPTFDLVKAEIFHELGRPNNLLGRFRQVHVVFGQTVWLDIFGEPDCVDVSNAYEIDYAGWIWDQVALLRKGARDELDLPHIAEELGDLGKREKRGFQSHLSNLILHLLKWRFQPQRRGRSWRDSIDEARDRLYETLGESTSLKTIWSEAIRNEYPRARKRASRETGLDVAVFPETCPYTKEQLADPEFYPEETSKT